MNSEWWLMPSVSLLYYNGDWTTKIVRDIRTCPDFLCYFHVIYQESIATNNIYIQFYSGEVISPSDLYPETNDIDRIGIKFNRTSN